MGQEEVQGILLIGAGARAGEDELQHLNDLDFLVITAKSHSYEREVYEIENVKFDLSYISLDLLKAGLKEKWPWLLSALAHYKIIFKRGDELDDILKNAARIYSLGPRALEKTEIRCLRFSLYQSWVDLMNRRCDPINSAFLANNLFKEVLVSYFKLNNIWVPKDKKVLDSISKTDQELFQLCTSFLAEQALDRKIAILEDILTYVLKPFGGILEHWERGEFPLN